MTGVERLLLAIQHLSLAPDLDAVQAVVRTAARELADCDGATFVLRDGERCYYADEDAIEPLWKGLRFPLEACISGWAMLHGTHVVIPDIYADARIPFEAYRPTFVKSLVMMPVRSIDPIAAIGAYWAHEHTATDDEVALLQGLANAASVALDKVAVHGQLASAVELNHATHRLAASDELTGLWNRRGFIEQARLQWEQRSGPRASVAFIDVDGLKLVNDGGGHDAGDALIRRVADVLRSRLRDTDVIARLGGDEFAVLSTDLGADELHDRLAPALVRRASVGTAPLTDIDLLPDALLHADARMYAAKRTHVAARAIRSA
ncbi:MAG: sensor domain-containing diguanylate cyclase [Propionibacteriales bacterium]|nr:sensor domain-containing diguanylate cyclase [Propionibacteriales bacterium]